MPGEPRVERRVFVVGVPRSGTTLVQSLLAAHRALTSFTESHFFDRHFSRLPLIPTPVLTRDPSPRLRTFLEENDDSPRGKGAGIGKEWPAVLGARALLPFQTRAVARRLLGVLDELARRRGRGGWVEKTPRHLRYAPFLQRLSPPGTSTHVVHVLRDGLEVVASLREASRSWERPYDLETCVRRWNRDVAFSLGRAGAANHHFVFYEELTAHPEEVLGRLLAGLGLEWEPEILAGYAASSRGLVTGDETWKAGVGRPIARSETSRRALSGEERDQARRTLRAGLLEQIRARTEEKPAP